MTKTLNRPHVIPAGWTDAEWEALIDGLTRWRLIKSGLALGALSFLPACGKVPSPATPEATTRTIDTAMGSVAVPVRPRRIVALDAYSTLQVLDELGAPLVAAGSLGGGTRDLVSEEAAKLPSIGITIKLDLEMVAAAQPDLIVGGKPFGEKIYSQLSAIAPTVLINTVETDWREILLATADTVNLREQASRPLAKIDERFAALQQAVAEAWPDGVTVSVLRIADLSGTISSWTTFWRRFIGPEILGRLEGVSVTADRLADSEGRAALDVSAERLRDVDADVILYYLGGGGSADIDPAEAERMLSGNPLWPHLHAVKADRVHQVDAGPWFSGGDIEAANRILDDLFRYLAGGEH